MRILERIGPTWRVGAVVALAVLGIGLLSPVDRPGEEHASCGSVVAPVGPGGGAFGSTNDERCNALRLIRAQQVVVAAAGLLVAIGLGRRFVTDERFETPALLATAVGGFLFLFLALAPDREVRSGTPQLCGNLFVTAEAAPRNSNDCDSARARTLAFAFAAGTGAGAVTWVVASQTSGHFARRRDADDI